MRILAGTGLDGENLVEPLTPRWASASHLPPVASSVSTDFFYGFGPRILDGGYPFASGRLRAAYEKYANMVDLVDMEVAPFYAFCAAFGDEGLSFGRSRERRMNWGRMRSRLRETPAVLERCWNAARKVLGLEEPAR